MIKDEYTIENDYPFGFIVIGNRIQMPYQSTTSERFRFLFKRTDKSDFGSKPLFRKKNWKKQRQEVGF